MGKLIVVSFLVLLASSALGQTLPCTPPCNTGVQSTSLGGFTRYYEVYLPTGISPGSPYPVMLYLTGYGNALAWNSPNFDNVPMLQTFAESNHIAIILPSAVIWDATPAYPPALSVANSSTRASDTRMIWNVDFFDSYLTGPPNDCDYLHSLVSTAVSSWGADPARVLGAGFSLGALELERCGALNASDFVGLGMWAGALYEQTGNTIPFNPTSPTNVYLQWGDADTVLPYCGGTATVFTPTLPAMTNSASADTAFNYWTSAMTCGTPVPNVPICTAGRPSSGFTEKIATGCAGGKSVQFVDWQNARHRRPDMEQMCRFWNLVFPATPCVQQVPTTTTMTSSNDPVLVGQPVTLAAKVSAALGSIPNGDLVEFKDVTATPAVVLATVPLSGGGASYTTTLLTFGSHSINANYLGDANFSASVSTTLNEVVQRYVSSTFVGSSMNPSSVGQPITFTATVSGESPTGTVTFNKNGTKLETVPLVNGQAASTKIFTAVGSKSITASYSGDATNKISNSAITIQVVDRATTTTTLSSSANPAAIGESIILTATVAPQFSGTPTGKVSFYNNTTLLGTVPLASGQAIFTRTFNTAGTKSLTAVYSGDAGFTGSTGSLTQAVQ